MLGGRLAPEDVGVLDPTELGVLMEEKGLRTRFKFGTLRGRCAGYELTTAICLHCDRHTTVTVP